MTEQRLALPLSQPKPVSALSRGAHVGRAAEVKPEIQGDGMRILERTLPAPVTAPEIKERELTFENVVAWLAVQDAATHKACGSILATEITQVYKEAKAEGFEFGRNAAAAATRADTEAQLGLLRDLNESAEMAYQQEQKQLGDICVEVITEAFAKIAGRLLHSEAATIGAVKEVLKRVKDEREVTIRVARDDVALLRAHEGDLVDALTGRKFQIVADSRVELGGCIVESRLGSFDGRLEVQLRELYETLKLARTAVPESI